MRFILITANHWTKSYTKKDILSCFVFFILTGEATTGVNR